MDRRLFQLFIAALLVVGSTIATSPAAVQAATGPLCYVDMYATAGGNTGVDWTNAYTSLQSALADTNCTTIWVANGTYTPGATRGSTFTIPSGVKLYGGFAGGEGSLGDRDWVGNFTALSGEIGNLEDLTDNVYTVVNMNGTSTIPITGTTVLDGFGIMRGYNEIGNGGGLHCYGGGSSNECSPQLEHLLFTENLAQFGGAMYLAGYSGGTSSPGLTDVQFSENSSLLTGGALYLSGDDGTASPTLVGVTFYKNHAGAGAGAMFNEGDNGGNSSPALANVTFYKNHADGDGGAIYNYGWGGTSSPVLHNVTFGGNTAGGDGGALYSTGQSSGASLPSLVNVILWGDSAVGSGDEIYNTLATPSISYSVVQGSGGSDSWDTGLGTDDGYNVDANPKLRIAADNGGETPTMALITGSSAIDAGNDGTCAAFAVSGVDQRGVSRPVGPHCDIGAYEGEVPAVPTDFEPDGMTEPTKYVSSAGAVYYYLSSEASWGGEWGSEFIGTDGDYVLNSDFDGDGATDPAKYVAGAGAIWYLGSADASWHGVYIGNDGDFIPASDFDGDGIADPAKYVAAAGAVWYLGSADSTWYGVYIGGLGGGDYVPGSDFDGDGKTDPAHTDSSGNVWYLGSADATLHGHFIGNDGPYVPRSDYDGDGITDPAKFVSPNIWYLASNNSDTPTAIPLGVDTSSVVPSSDFDGDGITDPAKFVDTADAIWYTQSSDATEHGVYMGADTYDIVN